MCISPARQSPSPKVEATRSLEEHLLYEFNDLVLLRFTKDELSQYISNLNVGNVAMKFRKAAVKARHQKELNDLRNRMQKEIDQSINELKMASDIRRMQAIEAQVHSKLKFIINS